MQFSLIYIYIFFQENENFTYSTLVLACKFFLNHKIPIPYRGGGVMVENKVYLYLS